MSVYFIRAGNDGPVKIGTAINPSARLAKFQCSHFLELRIIREIAGSHTEEHWMHRRFESLRIRGEWFRFDPAMLTVEYVPTPKRVKPPAPSRQASGKLYHRLIASFGTLKTLAEAINAPISTVGSWVYQDTIPRWRVDAIHEAAERLGVTLPADFPPRSEIREAA